MDGKRTIKKWVFLGMLFFIACVANADISVYNFICIDDVPDVIYYMISLQENRELLPAPINCSGTLMPLMPGRSVTKVIVHKNYSPVFTTLINRIGPKLSVFLYNTGIPAKPIDGLTLSDVPTRFRDGMGYIRLVNIAPRFTRIVEKNTGASPRFMLFKIIDGKDSPRFDEQVAISFNLMSGTASAFYTVQPITANELGYCFYNPNWPKEITCTRFMVAPNVATRVIFADSVGNATLIHVEFEHLNKNQ